MMNSQVVRTLNIHCYLGSKNCRQGWALLYVLKIIQLRFPSLEIVFVLKYLKDIRANQWNELDLVSWLEYGDIYLIACHPHQGTPKDWIPENLYDMIIHKLSHRIGFPRGDSLKCPIFRQDKLSYIHAVYDICIPTLRIRTHTQRDYLEDWENIMR